MTSDASRKLIENNLPLVASLARCMCRHQAAYEDLFQQGCVGLVQAAERFDPGRGFAFSTFAVPYIMGELRACCHTASAIRISRRDRAFLSSVRAMQAKLHEKLHREPTLPELASCMDVEPAELARRTITVQLISMDASDDDVPLRDRLSDSDPWLERIQLRDLLERLTAQERTLLQLRFVHGLSQQQTASQLGVSQPHISRMETMLRNKLRQSWYQA